jgi:transcriptional regulator with XRE-family HTH domain
MKLPNPVDERVGARVRSRRIVLDMSPKKLAAALGATLHQLQQWEAGTIRIGAAKLINLAEILGVTATSFFADVEPPNNVDDRSASNETPPSGSSILGSPPSLEALEVMRLTRAFTRIDSRALRATVVKLVETLAAPKSMRTKGPADA